VFSSGGKQLRRFSGYAAEERILEGANPRRTARITLSV
jgi:hypothetical protein